MNNRLRFFRMMRGMTQKSLGTALGYKKNCADVRVAQYESGDLSPKKAMLAMIAEVLNISPHALDAPICTDTDAIMHTLFAFEDIFDISVVKNASSYGIQISDEPHIMRRALSEWKLHQEAYVMGVITKADYDEWRYSFTSQTGGAKA